MTRARSEVRVRPGNTAVFKAVLLEHCDAPTSLCSGTKGKKNNLLSMVLLETKRNKGSVRLKPPSLPRLAQSRSKLQAPRRKTLSPAQTWRAVLGSSGCGRAARCSPASAPPCPCRAASSPPPRKAPRSGPGPSSPRSSGPGSSSCCGPAAGPRRGAWPGTTRASAVGRRLRWPAFPPSPASSEQQVAPEGRCGL